LDGIITSWNQAAERLYGYKAEEVMGKSVKMLIPQDRWGEEMEIVDRVRQSEQVRHFETVRQTKDGRLVDISLTVSQLTDEHGTLIGISGIARDITARKWADEELKRQARLLEATNKELEAFSYSVSHDLRAPLRSLEGLSLALLEDCSERLDETGKDYLKRIRGEIERMGQLIEDLLQLALATRMELRRESVDLSALAASRAEEVRKQWSGRQVELIVESELKAEGDCRLLGIVLDNLLGNAWKFTSGRERATVEVGAERLDRKTVYFVRDNGAGFDMTYAGKLFGVFQRLHAATEYPGTGIGLALVQRIVHRHGGRVWAEGAVDKGTTVYFTLP
jgi:PAS domain S-box-containing protein